MSSASAPSDTDDPTWDTLTRPQQHIIDELLFKLMMDKRSICSNFCPNDVPTALQNMANDKIDSLKAQFDTILSSSDSYHRNDKDYTTMCPDDHSHTVCECTIADGDNRDFCLLYYVDRLGGFFVDYRTGEYTIHNIISTGPVRHVPAHMIDSMSGVCNMIPIVSKIPVITITSAQITAAMAALGIDYTAIFGGAGSGAGGASGGAGEDTIKDD